MVMKWGRQNLIAEEKVISIPFHRFTRKNENQDSKEESHIDNTEPHLKEYRTFFNYFEGL